MKVCSSCEKLLEDDNFTKRSRSKDGLSSSCKECQKKVNHQSYQRYKTVPGSQKFRKIPVEESFQTLFPKLAENWDYSTNTILPTEITPRNSYKANWVCNICSYEWSARLNKIVLKGDRKYCPKCEGTIPSPVLTTHPTISEWVMDTTILKAFSKGSNISVSFCCPTKHHVFETSLKKFAFTCPTCSLNEKSVSVKAPHLISEWGKQNTLKPEEVSYSSKKIIYWTCAKQHSWETPVYQRVLSQTGCPTCSANSFSSTAEQDLTKYLQEIINTPINTNDRSILNGHELDILIPDRNTAIEYNGLYWHSEANGKGKTYHYDKWRACKEQGIQLIQVWEDDWNRNPELVKRMLAHKLGVSLEPRVYARNTFVSPVNSGEAGMFLSRNHLQGSVDGGIRLGLYDKKGAGELIAVMVLKTEPGTNGKTLNLLRYATSQPVPGGFTKLLKYVERTYTPESIVTFSDNTVSDGGLYSHNGFIPVKELKPDYMYVRNKRREHKFGYRLKRFRNDPTLQYVEGLTEKELAQLNGLPRVWDAGKTKWVKNV